MEEGTINDLPLSARIEVEKESLRINCFSILIRYNAKKQQHSIIPLIPLGCGLVN